MNKVLADSPLESALDDEAGGELVLDVGESEEERGDDELEEVDEDGRGQEQV